MLRRLIDAEARVPPAAPPSVGEALSAQFTDPRLGGVDGAWGVLARSAREESGPSEEEEESKD